MCLYNHYYSGVITNNKGTDTSQHWILEETEEGQQYRDLSGI